MMAVKQRNTQSTLRTNIKTDFVVITFQMDVEINPACEQSEIKTQSKKKKNQRIQKGGKSHFVKGSS